MSVKMMVILRDSNGAGENSSPEACELASSGSYGCGELHGKLQIANNTTETSQMDCQRQSDAANQLEQRRVSCDAVEHFKSLKIELAVDSLCSSEKVHAARNNASEPNEPLGMFTHCCPSAVPASGALLNSDGAIQDNGRDSARSTCDEACARQIYCPKALVARTRARQRLAKRTQTKSAAKSSDKPFAGRVIGAEAGNKCGKCQNHEIEISKKGHARDCPFKKCNCLKCCLLDARSDILQVISGKETKLKGTKKDPNCGFCQNHGIKILRKGHVRSCGFGQERHFKLDNCFDCEVHYIRNEVNRLQIKMRRAMKEDRTLSEEQRKNAREPITREEVEKVCDMARLARKKRESILLSQQVGECSSQSLQNANLSSSSSSSSSSPSTASSSSSAALNISAGLMAPNSASSCKSSCNQLRNQPAGIHNHRQQQQQQQLGQFANQSGVWRPWSQHQVAAAIAAQQQQQQQHLVNPMHLAHLQQAQQQLQPQPTHPQELNQSYCNIRRQVQAINGAASGQAEQDHSPMVAANSSQQQQLNSAITSMAVVANQTYLINSLQVVQRQQQQRRVAFNQQLQQAHFDEHINTTTRDMNTSIGINMAARNANTDINRTAAHSQPLPSPPSSPQSANQIQMSPEQPLPLTQRNMQVQQLFTNILRIMAEQYAQNAQSNNH